MGGVTGSLQTLVVPKGWKLADGTSEHTTRHYGIFIRENTVIASWEDEDGVDLVAKYGISGKTLLVTDVALLTGEATSKSITLTSGSVGLLIQ